MTAFENTNWKNYPNLETPITAQELNRLETGIRRAIYYTGHLASGRDLDQLYGDDWVGRWRFTRSAGLVNLPRYIGSFTYAALEVSKYGTGVNSTKQTITHAYGSMWRYSLITASEGDMRWGEWFYDQNSRGELPSGLNLDDLWGVEYAGTWRVLPSSKPEGFPDQLVLEEFNYSLEIIDGGHPRAQQQIIRGPRTSILRHSFNTSTTAKVNWGLWHNELGFHGELPPETNLEDLRGFESVGRWTIVRGTESVPSDMPIPLINEETVVEVEYNATSPTATQTLIQEDLKAWRKFKSSSVWGPWHLESTYSSGVRVAEVDQNGKLLNAVGDPYEISSNSTGSILKVLTSYVAIKFAETINDPDLSLDSIVEILPEMHVESKSSNSFYPNHSKTKIRNLHYTSLLPSDNDSAQYIAYVYGSKMEGSGTPTERFMRFMNGYSQEVMGFEGASYTRPVGSGLMSPYQTSLLLIEAMKDSFLLEVLSSPEYDVEYTTKEGTLETKLAKSIEHNALDYRLPNFIGGKTGNRAGKAHVALAYTHPSGDVRYVTMTDANDNVRYAETLKAVASSMTGSYPDNTYMAGDRFYNSSPSKGLVQSGINIDLIVKPGVYAIENILEVDGSVPDYGRDLESLEATLTHEYTGRLDRYYVEYGGDPGYHKQTLTCSAITKYRQGKQEGNGRIIWSGWVNVGVGDFDIEISTEEPESKDVLWVNPIESPSINSSYKKLAEIAASNVWRQSTSPEEDLGNPDKYLKDIWIDNNGVYYAWYDTLGWAPLF